MSILHTLDAFKRVQHCIMSSETDSTACQIDAHSALPQPNILKIVPVFKVSTAISRAFLVSAAKTVRTLKWNWKSIFKTVSKLIWKCLVSISFQRAGSLRAEVHCLILSFQRHSLSRSRIISTLNRFPAILNFLSLRTRPTIQTGYFRQQWLVDRQVCSKHTSSLLVKNNCTVYHIGLLVVAWREVITVATENVAAAAADAAARDLQRIPGLRLLVTNLTRVTQPMLMGIPINRRDERAAWCSLV